MAYKTVNRKPDSRKSRKHYSSGLLDDSCVLCGSTHVKSGRILHGHCVCEECIEYVSRESIQEAT